MRERVPRLVSLCHTPDAFLPYGPSGSRKKDIPRKELGTSERRNSTGKESDRDKDEQCLNAGFVNGHGPVAWFIQLDG